LVATEDDRVVGFAYGLLTPEIPTDGWYGLVREAVGPAAAERWLAGQFAVVWIAVHPAIGAGGWAGACWSGCWPRRAPSAPG
jgi:hypothetical protein